MRAAFNGLGRGGLLAVMAALVAALVVVAMLVVHARYATPRRTPGQKHGLLPLDRERLLTRT